MQTCFFQIVYVQNNRSKNVTRCSVVGNRRIGKQSCSRFWLQGWRNIVRDNRVESFSVVTWPNLHPIPKFNHLFLNVVIFGGYNTLTTFQTKCKTIFAQYLDNGLNLPNFKTETSLVEIWIISMSFLWRGQTRTIRALLSLCSLFLSSQSHCMQFDSIRNCIVTWSPLRKLFATLHYKKIRLFTYKTIVQKMP